MTKKKESPFKVDMNSEDVLIAGGTRRVFLHYHNRLQRMLHFVEDTKDVTLSDIAMLEQLLHELHSSLNFAPQKNQLDDSPNLYADYVLDSDDKAWQRAY